MVRYAWQVPRRKKPISPYEEVEAKLLDAGLRQRDLVAAFANVKDGVGLGHQLSKSKAAAPWRLQRRAAEDLVGFVTARRSVFSATEESGDEGRAIERAFNRVFEAAAQLARRLEHQREVNAATIILRQPLGAVNLDDLLIRLQDRVAKSGSELTSKELALILNRFLPAQFPIKHDKNEWADVKAISDDVRQRMSRARRKARNDARAPRTLVEANETLAEPDFSVEAHNRARAGMEQRAQAPAGRNARRRPLE